MFGSVSRIFGPQNLGLRKTCAAWLTVAHFATHAMVHTARPSLRDSVFRWLRDLVDHEIGHGLVYSFELEAELLLHGGED